jgi:choline dehydrogenase/4-pyridoxate dehydrogenase
MRARGKKATFTARLRLDRLVPALLGAYFAGTRPATVLPAGINSILRSRPNLDAPDLQIMFGRAASEAEPWLPGWNEWEDVFGLRPMVSHPESRGTILLTSSDPRAKPRIDRST